MRPVRLARPPATRSGRSPLLPVLLVLAASLLPIGAARAAETRLMRQPDIHGSQIVFVYGGDLWGVARGGGVARKLTNHIGVELLPMFSPDGKTVAFTAQYDGNIDVFSIPAEGGEPRRLTWHPYPDRACCWYPDGSGILIRSGRQSPTYRFDQYFKVSPEGGFAEALPLPVAGPACFSADGRELAFNQPSMEMRTWKRYQGGSAPDIWIYDFDRNESQKITDWTGSDEFPMWYGDVVYFNSDRTGKLNIWACDLKTKATRQVTQFDEFDVKWPALGPDAIVFENGGRLHVMDLPSEKVTKISVEVPADRVLARAEYRNVSHSVQSAGISPSAKRVVLEARGDIFTVPAKKGTYRNLTRTPGVRERGPVWSPDGRWIAYWSDKSGEYELCVMPQNGEGAERQVTHGLKGYGFNLLWSPDSKKILYSDQTGTLAFVTLETGDVTRVDKSEYFDMQDYGWSPDSKWVCFSKAGPNNYGVISLYSLANGSILPVTDGMTDDEGAAFSPDGKYLFFRSSRHFHPEFGAYDEEWVFPDATGLYALALAADTPSLVAAQSDEESPEPDAKAGARDKAAAKKDKSKGKESDEEEGGGGKEPPDVKVDADGIAARVIQLPVDPGNYFGLAPAPGRLFYLAIDDAGPGGDDEDGGGPPSGTLKFYDFEEREEKTVMDGVRSFELNKDGSKILVHLNDGHAIVDAAADQKADSKLAVDNLQMLVDPKAEWKQMFGEAWRLERDFFYDPNMHGVDWTAIGQRYGQLVDFVSHRSDLNYILGEMIAELNCSHTYVGGGDSPNVPQVDVGLLGADYDPDKASGRYRFRKIYRQSEWNQDVIAPLGAPGIQVKEGDYLLAVNGREIKAPEDLFAFFQNTAGRPASIRVNSRPDTTGAREYLVVPLDSDRDLRYTEWVAGNRRKVAEATGGRVAYLHVPDTATRGFIEFSKGFYSQVDRDALIVDGRFNSGGNIPDRMVDRLARRPLSFWAQRQYKPIRTPTEAILGPMVCVTNEYAGSGGDALPYYFRAFGLGPLIGKRTWGGLVGIGRNLPLMDGGVVTVPDFAFYSVDGAWEVENHGVDMDVQVEQLPELCVAGHDPQLEKAIEVVMERLKQSPPNRPSHPAYPVKTGVTPDGQK